jgi:hypothetical protein
VVCGKAERERGDDIGVQTNMFPDAMTDAQVYTAQANGRVGSVLRRSHGALAWIAGRPGFDQ